MIRSDRSDSLRSVAGVVRRIHCGQYRYARALSVWRYHAGGVGSWPLWYQPSAGLLCLIRSFQTGCLSDARSITPGPKVPGRFMRVQHQPLQELVRCLFLANKSSETEADLIAHHLVVSNLVGHESHGVIRAPIGGSTLELGASCAPECGGLPACH